MFCNDHDIIDHNATFLIVVVVIVILVTSISCYCTDCYERCRWIGKEVNETTTTIGRRRCK